jgi:hypothetical protein
MTRADLFPAASRHGAWEDYAVLAILAAAAVLAPLFLRARERHPDHVHSPPLAWLRAGLYFIVVITVSWLAGVLSAVLHAPLATPEQLDDPAWLGLVGLCMVAVIWGYVIWWPRGTLTYERERHVVVQGLFGLAWGSCSAQVPLILWAVIEEFGFGQWATALAVLFLLSGYSQIYQSGWWDIHVSPPHNIRAWNAKKVLFGHMPFLVATLALLAIHGNAGLFVMLHAAAMACSAIAMRFPPFWAKDGPPVSKETALGV